MMRSCQFVSLKATVLALALGAGCAGASAQSFNALWNFGAGADGDLPMAAMTYLGDKLYGTTGGGGTGFGTIYKYDLKTNAEEVVFNFGSGSSGCIPVSTLVRGGNLLYGTTQACGGDGNGTVFSFDPKLGTVEIIHTFTSGDNAASPLAGLLYKDGVLYGTAFLGGPQDQGAVFSIDIATGKFSTLHIFTGGADGGSPASSLIMVRGQLIGTSQIGGEHGHGTVYSVDPKSGASKVLHSFDLSDGGEPVSSVAEVDGVLYGTAQNGGTVGNGVLFALDLKTGKQKTLHSFNRGKDGGSPLAGVTSVNGTLFGTAAYGGRYGFGTMFSFDLATRSFKVVHDFANGTDGSYPQADLTQRKGTIYGNSGFGGPYGGGAIFSVQRP